MGCWMHAHRISCPRMLIFVLKSDLTELTQSGFCSCLAITVSEKCQQYFNEFTYMPS